MPPVLIEGQRPSGLLGARPPGGSERKSQLARVTVEDCLEREDNRFALVILGSRRARQIMKGSAPLVRSGNRPNVTSLREIAAGKVHFDRPSADAIEDWIQATHKKAEQEEE
jgi:DNA-directed RNA polymerase subunit omega